MFWKKARTPEISLRRIALLVAVGVPIVLACYWWARCNELQTKLSKLDWKEAGLSAGSSHQPDATGFIDLLEKENLSLRDFLSAYREKDPSALVAAYNEISQPEPELLAYTALYPQLYAIPPLEAVYSPGTVYLTFDDGPSDNTQAVLDILEKRQIKATFFVCPKADGSDAELLRRIAAAGHTIGIHSATHVYKEVYADVDSFLSDFSRAYDLVFQATGQKTDIFRFPGGSINAHNTALYQQLIAEMTRRGFTYYDWNVDGGETSHNVKADSIRSTVVNGAGGRERAIVLLHDGPGHQETVKALDSIISSLQKKGYQFASLDKSVKPIVFSYIAGEQ